eukprot:Anaeramoba_ignava/a90439_4.p1 GENE.a90439_4~~a90439_4.p1  ORF type:complete len:100 (-),score=3.23 a90439_4:54-353(-)
MTGLHDRRGEVANLLGKVGKRLGITRVHEDQALGELLNQFHDVCILHPAHSLGMAPQESDLDTAGDKKLAASSAVVSISPVKTMNSRITGACRQEEGSM